MKSIKLLSLSMITIGVSSCNNQADATDGRIKEEVQRMMDSITATIPKSVYETDSFTINSYKDGRIDTVFKKVVKTKSVKETGKKVVGSDGREDYEVEEHEIIE